VTLPAQHHHILKPFLAPVPVMPMVAFQTFGFLATSASAAVTFNRLLADRVPMRCIRMICQWPISAICFH